MCPFKHLLTSQLWTNQSPTGWSTGDGKSHLRRDVKTHSTSKPTTTTKKINNQRLHTKAQCFPASHPAIPVYQENSCLGEQRHKSKFTMCLCQEYQPLHHTTRLETQTDNNTLDHWFATSFNLLNILPGSNQHKMPNWKGRRGKKRGQRVNVSVAFGTGCLQIMVWSSRADLQAKA